MLICPQDVYFGSEEGRIPQVHYPDECWHCNACVLECPNNAIRLEIPLPMRFSWDVEEWVKDKEEAQALHPHNSSITHHRQLKLGDTAR